MGKGGPAGPPNLEGAEAKMAPATYDERHYEKLQQILEGHLPLDHMAEVKLRSKVLNRRYTLLGITPTHPHAPTKLGIYRVTKKSEEELRDYLVCRLHPPGVSRFLGTSPSLRPHNPAGRLEPYSFIQTRPAIEIYALPGGKIRPNPDVQLEIAVHLNRWLRDLEQNCELEPGAWPRGHLHPIRLSMPPLR